jgi:hypothetical protein
MSPKPESLPATLPDFAVIGAMKAGTTTLYRYLLEHPQVGMSRMKETDYFIRNKNFDLGEDWYRSQFTPGFEIYGEVSPNYTMRDVFLDVPETLSQAAPDARLIFLARDPVDRLVSHYHHVWLLGHIDARPEELLGSEHWPKIVAASSYHRQLQPYLEHFDREQLLILDFDDLRRKPQAVFDRVCDHIGAARMPVPDIGAQNEGESLARMPRSVQRLWQSKAMRRLDPLISRGARDMARKVFSHGPKRSAPKLTPKILKAATEALREDARAFRKLSGLPFNSWKV